MTISYLRAAVVVAFRGCLALTNLPIRRPGASRTGAFLLPLDTTAVLNRLSLTGSATRMAHRFWLRTAPCAWLLVSVLFLSNCGGVNSQSVTLYRQGNAQYAKGQFDQAAKTYEQVIASGARNGAVYFNLGNAYFKQLSIGHAVLAYERALRLMPRDRDISANLSIANLRTVDQIKSPEPWLISSWLLSVTVNEVLTTTALFFYTISLLTLLYLLTKKADLRRLALRIGIGVAPLLLISLVVLSARLYQDAGHDEAIILVTVTEVRSGPGGAYEKLFTLHEGTKVRIVETRGNQLRISIPDGKSGWLEEEALERI